MPPIPLLLQNDQILYDALLQTGALSGGDFPPREFLLWQTGLSEEELQLALERFCQQKILQPAAGGSYTAFAKPVFLHYHNFRSFGQMLEYPNGTITVDLLSAGPMETDSYTAEILRIPPKETIISIIRLYSRDGVPFAYEKYHVRYSLLKNTPKAEFQKSPVLHIVQNNLSPAPSAACPLIQSQYFSMMPSHGEDQKYLHLPPGGNILRIVGRVYHQELPICSFIVRADADQCFLKNQSSFHLDKKCRMLKKSLF